MLYKGNKRGPKVQQWYDNSTFCKIIALITLGYDTRNKIKKLNTNTYTNKNI